MMSEMLSDSGEENLAPTLVRASAGTGKTYQLTSRFLKLLIQGVSPETILAEIEHSDLERLNAAQRWVNSAHLDAHLEARLKGAIAQRRRLLARPQAQHA